MTDSIQIGVDGKALCDVMRCDRKKFEALCADVKATISEPNHMVSQQSNARKRGRSEMDDGMGGDNAEMFCDEYQTRRDRKHQKWKESVLRQDERRRAEAAKKKNAGNGNEGGKRRKIIVRGGTNKEGPTKMFSIFDATKQTKNVGGDAVEENNLWRWSRGGGTRCLFEADCECPIER